MLPIRLLFPTPTESEESIPNVAKDLASLEARKKLLEKQVALLQEKVVRANRLLVEACQDILDEIQIVKNMFPEEFQEAEGPEKEMFEASEASKADTQSSFEADVEKLPLTALYRKIAARTHPDRPGHTEERQALFVRATKAYKTGNYAELCVVWDELNTGAPRLLDRLLARLNSLKLSVKLLEQEVAALQADDMVDIDRYWATHKELIIFRARAQKLDVLRALYRKFGIVQELPPVYRNSTGGAAYSFSI